MAHAIAIIDLSWTCYKFRQYYKDSCRIDSEGHMFPTGHVYGTINVVQQLASQYKAVILAVDSRASYRYEILPEYKSGRHVSTGDPYEDYKIMTDLMNILKLCTYQDNVFYIKHEGLESDDIIASWIKASQTDDSRELYCYFNDVDILQTQGRYHWFRSFHEPEMDRTSYLKEKFGLEMDWLPVWYKVVRGDPSDGIPSAIPRYPSKKLIPICSGASPDADVDWFIKAVGVPVVVEDIKRNYGVVVPNIISINSFTLKRLGCSHEGAMELLQYYQINDFVPVGGS